MQNIIELDDVNFDQEVKRSTQPVLVMFFANWCGACKKQHPVIEELLKDYSGKVRIGEVDVDKGKIMSAQYDIKSIPTIVIFQNGKPVERLVGLMSKSQISSILNKYL